MFLFAGPYAWFNRVRKEHLNTFKELAIQVPDGSVLGSFIQREILFNEALGINKIELGDNCKG